MALEPNKPPIQWYRGSFLGVKRPRREVYHSPEPVLRLVSEAIPLLPPTCLHGVDRRNFTFLTCQYHSTKAPYLFIYHRRYKILANQHSRRLVEKAPVARMIPVQWTACRIEIWTSLKSHRPKPSCHSLRVSQRTFSAR
jgi:hypothetical protein